MKSNGLLLCKGVDSYTMCHDYMYS